MVIIIKAVDDPDANDDVDFDEAGGAGDGGHRSSLKTQTCPYISEASSQEIRRRL